CFFSWLIFHGFQIQDTDFFFSFSISWHLLKKALACFVAKPLVGNQLFKPFRNLKYLSRFIIRAIIINAPDDFTKRVDTYYIGCAESSRFWPAYNRYR